MTLAIGIFCAVSACGAGSPVLAMLGLSCSRRERIVLATGVGLAMMAYGIYFLGILSLLQPLFLWGLLCVFLAGFFVKVPAGDFAPASKTESPSGVFEKMLLSLTMLCLFFAVAGMFAPETANDSLCYHLNLPKRFLQAGKIYVPPYDINGAFPLLMEMLYTLGLSLQGAPLAKFFHLLTGLLAAASVGIFAGKDSRSRYCLWGAAILFTTPGILNQLGTTYIDVALACYIFLGLIALTRGFEAAKSDGWFILAGIFFGAALSIKFLALVFMVPSCGFMIWEGCRKEQKIQTVFSHLILFIVPAVFFSCLWYFRSFLVWGNPVYPFFYQIFKSGDPATVYELGLPKTLLGLLRAPWIMTMSPQRFEGFGDQLGPAYLAFAPLILSVRGDRFRGPLILWCGLSFVLWFFLGQSLRFFLPVLPVLAFLMIGGFSAAETGSGSSRGSVLLRSLVLAVLLIHTGLAGFHFRREVALFFGRTSVASYLKKAERTYDVAQWANSHLPVLSKILAVDESHLFYFDPMIIREHAFARVTRYESRFKDPADLMVFLKNEGITHLLSVEGLEGEMIPPGMPSSRLPSLLFRDQNKIAPFLKSLYTTRYSLASSRVVIYRLYEILP